MDATPAAVAGSPRGTGSSSPAACRRPARGTARRARSNRRPRAAAASATTHAAPASRRAPSTRTSRRAESRGRAQALYIARLVLRFVHRGIDPCVGPGDVERNGRIVLVGADEGIELVVEHD